MAHGIGRGAYRGAVLLSLLAALAVGMPPHDVVEWESAWPSASGPGYGGSNGMFSSPFIYKDVPSKELWSFTLTGFSKSGVVVDHRGLMYVAATASGADAFPYVYCVDISSDTPHYLWLESLDTTGSAIYGTPLISYEDGQQVIYVAATTSGTATLSDNTYIYAFAANSSQTSPTNKRTDLLWTYPPTISAAFSDVGEIVGSGAVHHNGTIMFGRATRGHPDYGGSNGVLALRPGGSVAWTFVTEAPVRASLLVGGKVGTTACCDLVYFVSKADGGPATLHAVRVDDGTPAWSFGLTASESLEDPPAAPPGFGAFGDVLVCFGDMMFSVDARTGALNWAESVSESGYIAAAAAVFEDQYYVGNTAGRLYHLRVAEDNSGLILSPSKRKGKAVSEMSRTMGIILSSPLIFGGGSGVLQVDYNGVVIAFSLSGKKELWRYGFGALVSDGRQPAMTSKGEILLGVGSTIKAIGGSGGCLKGYSTLDVHGVDAQHPKDFCAVCASGDMSDKVGSAACTQCVPGKWANKEGATFCYRCSHSEWCPGANQCVPGNTGTMCAACIKGYYLLFSSCEKCPHNPFVYTLAVIAVLGVAMMLYMHFTRGTKFAYEVAKDDVIAVYVNNGTWCQRCSSAVTCGLLGTKAKRVECKVTRVIDDFSLEVAGNFGNMRKMKDVPFWLIKCRVYGDEVRKQGSGRVTVGQPVHLLDDTTKAALKAQIDRENDQLEGDETADAGAGLDLTNLMRKDVKADLGILDGVSGEDRSIVYGKTQSAGTEVIMAASLIVVGYAQSTSLFVEIPIGWPYFFTRFFGMVSKYFYFDFESLAISPDCQWYWSYMRKWYTAMLLPMVLWGFLIVQYYFIEACTPHILIRKQKQNKVFNTACIMMVLLYVFVTAKTIEPYDCTIWEDGTSTLNKDPSISCQWTAKGGTEFTAYAGMALMGIFFFIFYGVGIPAFLFSMLYTAKVNHTMGSVMTKEKFGWIYIRFTYEFYFWEIVIMFRKFVFVLVALLTDTPRSTLSWCMVANIAAMLIQYYYRPFNCFDCLLSRSRRCTHWGAMDQLEIGLLAAQMVTLSVGLYLIDQGETETETPKPGDPLSTTDLIMLTAVGIAFLLMFVVITYLYVKTALLRNKMKNAGDKNEYQTAQNMQAVNTDAADFFCGC